jgi:hypothetical protein|tara:strand:- start:309 stop:785 length:477 start_codon:yes stop_codon:yes gene_type:complete
MTDTSYSHAIKLDNYRQTSINKGFDVSPDTIEEGQVMIRVSKVALTSNSVSYAIGSQAGMMPWLDVFPAPEGLGHIPCWGYGDVVYSKHPDVEEGERLYDFFPIASHIICTPGKTHERHAPCLPALQKRYADLSSESKAALQNVLEESACLNFLTARI